MPTIKLVQIQEERVTRMVAKKKTEKEIKIRSSYEITRLSKDYLFEVYEIILPLLIKDISRINKKSICNLNEIIKKTGSD